MLLWHRLLYRKGWVALLRPWNMADRLWSIAQRFAFEQKPRAPHVDVSGFLCDHGRARHLHF
jgi:hypothetical protein